MLESNAANGNEDYVADSEDEATKNFKVRVCTVRCWTRDPDQPQTLEKTIVDFWFVVMCVFYSFIHVFLYVHIFVDPLWLPQLFTKRYYKTKHGTYVPTLREYWKPGAARKDLMSIRSKRRWRVGGVFPCQVQWTDSDAEEMQEYLPMDNYF